MFTSAVAMLLAWMILSAAVNSFIDEERLIA